MGGMGIGGLEKRCNGFERELCGVFEVGECWGGLDDVSREEV